MEKSAKQSQSDWEYKRFRILAMAYAKVGSSPPVVPAPIPARPQSDPKREKK